MDPYRTRICLSLRSQTLHKSFGMCGGDDGARTRDLCRDSKSKASNILELIRGSRRIVSELTLIPKRTVPCGLMVGLHYSPAFAASVSTSAMFCIISSGTLCLFCKYAGLL